MKYSALSLSRSVSFGRVLGNWDCLSSSSFVSSSTNPQLVITNCGLVLEETKLELERQSQLPRTRPKDTDRDKLKAEYFTSIQRRIKSNWRKPPGVSDNANCTVSILQSVRGEVLKVAVEQCTGGGAALRKSLENAVRASSPLPSAPSTWLFDRRLRLRITLP